MSTSISTVDFNEAEEDENFDIVMTPWKDALFLRNFEEWLISAAGKQKPMWQAKQHSRQVECMQQEFMSKHFSIE